MSLISVELEPIAMFSIEISFWTDHLVGVVIHTNQDIASNLDIRSPDLTTSNPSPSIRQSWD